MEKPLKVHFSSKKMDWETPQALFDGLNKEFKFDIDVCATASNTKTYPFYYGPGSTREDGLAESWCLHHKTCWMNPPYGKEIVKWVAKAYEESLHGVTTVALVPARTDTRWFHDYIYNKPNVEIRFLKGRVKFVGAKHAAPFP